MVKFSIFCIFTLAILLKTQVFCKPQGVLTLIDGGSDNQSPSENSNSSSDLLQEWIQQFRAAQGQVAKMMLSRIPLPPQNPSSVQPLGLVRDLIQRFQLLSQFYSTQRNLDGQNVPNLSSLLSFLQPGGRDGSDAQEAADS